MWWMRRDYFDFALLLKYFNFSICLEFATCVHHVCYLYVCDVVWFLVVYWKYESCIFLFEFVLFAVIVTESILFCAIKYAIHWTQRDEKEWVRERNVGAFIYLLSVFVSNERFDIGISLFQITSLLWEFENRTEWVFTEWVRVCAYERCDDRQFKSLHFYSHLFILKTFFQHSFIYYSLFRLVIFVVVVIVLLNWEHWSSFYLFIFLMK